MGNWTATSSAGRNSRRIRAVVATLFVAALLIARPVEAQGDTPQPDGPPDTGSHSWCYLSGFNQRTTADAAMTWLRDQTVVQTLYPGACDAHTDVRWGQGNLSGAYGEARCRTRWDNGRCDTYNVTLDMGAINNAARPNEQLSKTACHELGHTVGVRHYFDNDLPGGDTAHSCLRSGEVQASWTNLRVYGHHHRTQHINPWFS